MGDTPWRPRRSRWRESLCMLRELAAALLPCPGLQRTLQHWPDVVQHLADRPRRRKRRQLS
jgi:hypothetical protein